MKALVIDLGRSFIRYGLVEKGIVRAGYRQPMPRAGFVPMIRDIAEDLGIKLSEVILAIAAPGPFTGEKFKGLNVPEWSFSVTDLQRQLTPRLIVVHDVIGGALGALNHPDKELIAGREIGAEALSHSPCAYIQTGVGLGAAALIPMPDGGWLPISGEGGSATVAPMDEDEELVFHHFKEKPGQFGYPTAQEILSTESIHRYGAALEVSLPKGGAREIFRAARRGNEECIRVAMTYAGFLGSFASAIAFMYRAYDGVAIGGYLPPLLSDQARRQFVTRFRGRGKASKQLLTVPVHFIDDEYNTLWGLASLVEKTEDQFRD